MNTRVPPLSLADSGLSKNDFIFLKKLKTPERIQDYLNTLPFNFEKKGQTYFSPERVLRMNTAQCFEGALIAATCLWIQGERPLLLDLQSTKKDVDHVVALFNRDGFWGGISKTNHGVLRYREPIYKTVRELALSFFHEYFLPDGTKTLKAFSRPFDLIKWRTEWITAKDPLFDLVDALDESPHTDFLTLKQRKNLRKADHIERQMGEIIEWKS